MRDEPIAILGRLAVQIGTGGVEFLLSDVE